ncbi:MAG: ScyD/ScyE family protein, partial [Pseudonocardiaceae bacterium]
AGRQHRILTGLPSLATADGSDIAGPQDVWLGRRGELLLAVGLGNTADRRSQLGAAASRLGTIQRFVPGKGLTTIVDVAQYELGANPDGSSTPDGRDSNPYSVAADGSGFLVSDAGGNTVYRVGRNGSIRPLVVLPVRSVPAPTFLGLPPGAMTPMQAVPTAALRAPDGSYFVAELTGFPFPVGEARVYRVSAGGSPTIAATGFTNIIDIALDRHGRLYVLELTTEGLLSGATTGQITRVDLRSGTRTVLQTPPLDSPTSLAIASDGHTLYVTNHGRSVGAGEILRMRLTS